jgi:hypothetical protein
LPREAHRAERAHAAIGLELLAVDEDQLAGALLAPGQQRADHHRVGAGDDGLGDVAGVLHAAVGDDRDAGRLAGQRGLVTAVIWGTPTPATTRVVQIEPGPTPTLTASAPASTRAWAPARVATLPPMTWTCRSPGRP